MNIVVLYGEDTNRSLIRLNKFIDVARARDWELVSINADSGNSIKDTVLSASLFAKQRIFVLREPAKIAKRDLDWLIRESPKVEGTMIVYYKTFLRKEFLAKLPKGTKVEEFKPSENIFIFLDSFRPGNSKQSLSIFHKIVKDEAPEFIFAMLSSHLRDLYIASISPQKLSYQAWRVGKLKRQAGIFPKDKLREIISELAVADIKSKTSSESLASLLDLIIVTKLE